MTKRWTDERDLAKLILAVADKNKRVALSPETATFVARRLLLVAEKPTRNEVARMICGGFGCAQVCYSCAGRANVIVAAYGARLESPPAPDEQTDDRSAPAMEHITASPGPPTSEP